MKTKFKLNMHVLLSTCDYLKKKEKLPMEKYTKYLDKKFRVKWITNTFRFTIYEKNTRVQSWRKIAIINEDN